ncbi:MAG: STAS domain-containing protein [Anaerolineae bacterium]
MMQISTHAYDDQITVLSVAGAIDGSSAPQLRETIMEVCESDKLLLLNMEGVHFMSSAGLRVMLLLHRQIQQVNGRVVLVGLLEPIYDAMEATGFLKYFETAPDIETGAQLLGV